MLVERRIASLLPDARIARRVKAAEHDGMIDIEVVEYEVGEPGDERPASRAVQDRLPFWIVLHQVERKGYRTHETVSRLCVPLPIPASCLCKVGLGLGSEPNVQC